MSRAKSIMAVCAGALALAALASPVVATAQWMVSKATLSGTESKRLATSAAVDRSITIKAAGITVTCGGSAFAITPQIEASGEMASAHSLEFTLCIGNENCQVPVDISTNPVLIDLALDPGSTKAVLATILSKTKILALISYVGEKCALLGQQPVTGKVKALAPVGQEEFATQLVEPKVTAESSELKVGSSAAEVVGSALLKLESGAPWNFL
jgi:hypothetical protein